jgi:zinc transporter
LGINVGGIPGADNPTAFAIFLAFLAIVVGVQIAFFRSRQWF